MKGMRADVKEVMARNVKATDTLFVWTASVSARNIQVQSMAVAF